MQNRDCLVYIKHLLGNPKKYRVPYFFMGKDSEPIALFFYIHIEYAKKKGIVFTIWMS